MGDVFWCPCCGREFDTKESADNANRWQESQKAERFGHYLLGGLIGGVVALLLARLGVFSPFTIK